MNKRQDADNSFSFGYDSQKEIDLAYAQSVAKVLRGVDYTRQTMGKNILPMPQGFSPVQVNLYKSSVALAGDGNILTVRAKGNFQCSDKVKALDLNFSSLDEIVSAICGDNDTIINLTQHSASDEQVESNVIEPTNKAAVQAAITFDAIPSTEEMVSRAQLLASIAKESGAKKAMIGGAPFFMSTLERVLIAHNITPVYAFSVRESVEKDGVKTSVFRHAGFVEL